MKPDPATLRALAKRVETEEPIQELQEATARALGYVEMNGLWTRERGLNLPAEAFVPHPPKWLTSIDAAAGLMSMRWSILAMSERGGRWVVTIEIHAADYGRVHWSIRRITVQAPTEPQARTAAALRVMAAEADGP